MLQARGFAYPDAQYLEPTYPLEGDAARYDRSLDNDHFYQARDLFNLMDSNQKNQLFSNIADAMDGVPSNIIDKQLSLFEQISLDYAREGNTIELEKMLINNGSNLNQVNQRG